MPKKIKETPQSLEIQKLLRESGMTLVELSQKAAVNLATLKRVAAGHQQAGKHTMVSIRQAATIPVYSANAFKEGAAAHGAPISRLRQIPVVSWAQAGQAMAYDDLPSDWMRRIASDADDPFAFCVEIVGDSMEPIYREGQLAVLLPSHEVRNGDVVVANIKNKGAIMKLYHARGEKIELSSYNDKPYPPKFYSAADFHWIYPVDSVISKLKRR
jgi:SOS-response transcriptional repressor LexA